MITFVTNDERTAISVAVKQSENGGWRCVFRDPPDLFQVHDRWPLGEGLVEVAVARNGVLEVAE